MATTNPKKGNYLGTARIPDSAAKIETLLERKENDGGAIKPYPGEITDSLAKANDIEVLQAGCFIPRSSFVGILDAVRNLVLDWAIKLERAGIHGDGISFTAREQQQARESQPTINVGTINSLTGNLGIGITSRDITNSTLNLDQVRNLVNQIKSHSEALTNEGVDGLELSAALQAVEKRLAENHPTVLRQALGELEKVIVKASSSLIAQGALALLHQIIGTGIPIQ